MNGRNATKQNKEGVWDCWLLATKESSKDGEESEENCTGVEKCSCCRLLID
jgi:hypothetical protein